MHKRRYSVWMPNLAPSEKILKAIQQKHMTWQTFKKKYKKEIWGVADTLDKKDLTIKNHGQKFTLRLIRHLAKIGEITLMCHCEIHEKQCHLRALAELMKKENI